MPLGLVTAFPVTHLWTTRLQHTFWPQPQGLAYACCIFGPCRISSDYLFFWDWWDGEGRAGQYSSEAEKQCIFHSSFFWQSIFWTLSSITLYPSCVHLVKGGEVCLNDSDFLPEIHFPQSGNFISKRKLNLLAILNYVYPLPPPKNPKSSRD